MSHRVDRGAALAAGALGFIAYALTLHPGIPGGDAGELAAAACAGGVAHPPGYPLHGLLLRAFGLFATSKLAAFHLSSALCSAGTIALLVDLVRRWTGRLTAGLLAGAAWFASPLAWLYSTTVEVFALHALLVVATTWAFTREAQHSTPAARVLLGLLGGLALTHHQTALFVVGPLLIVRRAHWRHLLPGLLLGCLPLLLLPLWSATDTLFSWGDARSLEGFLTHVLRREYGTFQLASLPHAAASPGAYLAAFAEFEWRQSFGLVVLLALLGTWAAPRPWQLVGVGTLALSVGLFGALANLSLDDPLFREVVARFFLMPHLVLCTAAGLAFRSPRAAGVFTATLLVFGVVQRPRHDAQSVRQYGLALLDQPAGALVLTQGDLIGNSMRALQACEGVKPEVLVVDQQLLTWDWYVARLRRTSPSLAIPKGTRWHPTESSGFRLGELLAANAARPVFICGDLKPGEPIALRLVPSGLCEQVLPSTAPFDAEAWFNESAARLPSLAWSRADAPLGSWEQRVRRDVWRARAQRGLTALRLGIELGDARWLARARDILQACADEDEAAAPEVFKNLGIAAGRLGDPQAMRRALRRYISSAPESDPELPTIRALAQ